MRNFLLSLATMAALSQASCAPAAPAEASAAHEMTHCEIVRAHEEYDSYMFPWMPEEAELAAAMQEAQAFAETVNPSAPYSPLYYEPACAAFVSGQDAALRELIRQYLDLNQEQFGHLMVRTLEFDDAIAILNEGGAHAFRRQLRAGVPYRFIATCDNECEDVDLRLTDAQGVVVAENFATDNFPLLEFTPETGGDYFVVVSVFACSIEPCYAGMRVLEDRGTWALEPRFGTLDVAAAAFDDPLEVEVEAGGDVDMQRRQSTCAGHISENPALRIHYTAGEQPSPLIISAGATDDITLVINGPDGLWYCDDDGGALGLNPMVAFLAPESGQYDIWVGVFGQPDQLVPARIVVSQSVSQ